MAATQQSTPAVSYKEKLLQPSEHDELSHPDQAPLPKLPPVKDEGSPPMTINVPAPAPAGEDDATSPKGTTTTTTTRSSSSSAGKPWSPKGNTQSAIDARFKFSRSASGKKGVPKEDYETKEGTACAVQPQNVDDYASDQDVPPPEADWLKGTAKQPEAAAATDTTTSTSSQEQAQPTIPDAAATKIAGTVLSDLEQEAIADPSTADLIAAATEDTDAPATTPLPAANAVIVNADGSSDVTGIQADAILPAAAPTPAAAATAGLAELTAEADAAEATGGTGSTDGDTSPDEDDVTAAAAAPDEAAGASAGGDARPAAESYGHLMQAPAAAGDAAAVPAPATPEPEGEGSGSSSVEQQVMQLDAAAGGGEKDSGSSSSGSGGGVVQQVVDAAKSAVGAASEAVSGGSEQAAAAAAPAGKEAGSSLGGAVGAVLEAGKSAVDSATAAASAAVNKDEAPAADKGDQAEEHEHESGGSHHGGIGGAVGAVFSGLKDVLLGPDVPVEAVTAGVGEAVGGSAGDGDGDGGDAAAGGALGQEMQRSADEEGKPASFAVL